MPSKTAVTPCLLSDRSTNVQELKLKAQITELKLTKPFSKDSSIFKHFSFRFKRKSIFSKDLHFECKTAVDGSYALPRTKITVF